MPAGERGELMVKGLMVMDGYYRNEASTREAIRPDGWMHTGDIATVDEDGYYTIVDRKKDMINTAGYNVYPAELERILCSHPSVALAAVRGVPDEAKGELAKAYVMLKPGAAASGRELADHCRRHLAAYKVPRAVQFVESVPITSSGKIMRRLLTDIDDGRVALDEVDGHAAGVSTYFSPPRRGGEIAEPRPQRPEQERQHEDAGEQPRPVRREADFHDEEGEQDACDAGREGADDDLLRLVGVPADEVAGDDRAGVHDRVHDDFEHFGRYRAEHGLRPVGTGRSASDDAVGMGRPYFRALASISSLSFSSSYWMNQPIICRHSASHRSGGTPRSSARRAHLVDHLLVAPGHVGLLVRARA